MAVSFDELVTELKQNAMVCGATNSRAYEHLQARPHHYPMVTNAFLRVLQKRDLATCKANMDETCELVVHEFSLMAKIFLTILALLFPQIILLAIVAFLVPLLISLMEEKYERGEVDLPALCSQGDLYVKGLK